jgi:hypothetical protein
MRFFMTALWQQQSACICSGEAPSGVAVNGRYDANYDEAGASRLT